MRTGKVHWASLVGCVLLAAAGLWFFRVSEARGQQQQSQKDSRIKPASQQAGRSSEPHQDVAGTKLAVRPLSLPGLPPAIESPHATGTTGNEEWIRARIAELDGLAWFDDPESLNKILAELQNSQPEIRAGALAAVVSFGSRDAVPQLERAAQQTRDSKEHKEIEDAIEYLKLPTMVEHLENEGSPVNLGE